MNYMDMIKLRDIVVDLMQRDRLTLVYPHDRVVGSSPILDMRVCYECDAEWKPKEGDDRECPTMRLTHQDTCPWQRLVVLTETDDV